MMKIRNLVAAFAVVAMSTPAFAATNLTGSYLLTVNNARPPANNGAKLCATLVENGSVLGFPNSGTVTIQGYQGSFFTRNHAFTAEVPLGNNSFLVFSGELGHAQIKGTSFVEVLAGNFAVAGNFTEVPASSCPPPPP